MICDWLVVPNLKSIRWMIFKALRGQLLCASFQTTFSPLSSYPAWHWYTHSSCFWSSWKWEAMCGAPGHRSLSKHPISCLQGIVSNFHDLPWVPKGKFEQLLIREGGGDAETREEQPRNNNAALGQGPGSFSGHTQECMFQLFKEWNSPTNGRCQHSSSQIRHLGADCHSVLTSNSLQPNGLQCDSLPCPSPSPRACSNSCPLSWWCHPTISSSVVPFSSCV